MLTLSSAGLMDSFQCCQSQVSRAAAATEEAPVCQEWEGERV